MNRTYNLLFTFVLLSFLFPSCVAANEITSTPAVIPTNTLSVFTLAKTHTPPATAIPTHTPAPSFDGPKLIYKQLDFSTDKSVLYMMNSTGTARKVIELPHNGYVRDIPQAISPDGKWIAFYTGSTITKDMALNLYAVDTGEVFFVASLLSKDFPDNFQKAYQKIQQAKAEFSEDVTFGTMEMDFEFALQKVSWSPDERYLAFASEMDGPTSDLYIFDIQEKKIERKTDDLFNIGYIEWLDNGEAIYFTNSVPLEPYPSTDRFIYYPNNNTIHKLDMPGWAVREDCLKSQFCTWYIQGDGGDPHNISLINLATGNSQILWESSFQDYAIALSYGTAVISGPYEETPKPGTYFVDFLGNYRLISDCFFLRLAFWDKEPPVFIGGSPDGIYLISLNGEIQKIYDGVYYDYSISPDKKWLIAYNNSPYVDSTGLVLFDQLGKTVKIVGDEKIENVIWHPNSDKLFYFNKNFYSVSIPDGELKLIEKETNFYIYRNEYYEDDYRWIP
jgi:hypothetical protein